MIKQFIQHIELYNSIYLLLRTTGGRKYTYLGKLEYLFHDNQLENPVRFQWQILDWDIPESVLNRMGLILQPTSTPLNDVTPNTLTVTPIPIPQSRTGHSTSIFQARKVPDQSERDARNKALGRDGELLIVTNERNVLIAGGRPDLAGKVRHIAEEEGDGAGYDVLSYTHTGEVKYIEVKTTRGPDTTPFYLTSNEVAFSGSHAGNYYLYRVHGFDASHNRGQVFVLQGDVSKVLALTPISYRANVATDS